MTDRRVCATERAVAQDEVRGERVGDLVVAIEIDYEAAPNRLLNLDVRRLFVRTDAEVNSGLVRARAVVDPWIVAAALRYRF